MTCLAKPVGTPPGKVCLWILTHTTFGMCAHAHINPSKRYEGVKPNRITRKGVRIKLIVAQCTTDLKEPALPSLLTSHQRSLKSLVISKCQFIIGIRTLPTITVSDDQPWKCPPESEIVALRLLQLYILPAFFLCPILSSPPRIQYHTSFQTDKDPQQTFFPDLNRPSSCSTLSTNTMLGLSAPAVPQT